MSSSLVIKFLNAGLTKVMDLFDLKNGQWRTVNAIADKFITNCGGVS